MVIKNLIDKLIYGGDKKQREYEVVVLRAFRDALNEDQKNKLDCQIKLLCKVQRWHGGKVTAFFDINDEMKQCWPKNIALFPDKEIVAKIEGVLGGRKFTARIEFYKGYLLYIKFSQDMNLFGKETRESIGAIGDFLEINLRGGCQVKKITTMFNDEE
ncbi:hypothetical protein [Aeromonas rivipollensis]|uniref:hypothetical protein n=1 Tax=Aeromonas rivipollensis TaxID=948519 RepID=UPI003D18FF18